MRLIECVPNFSEGRNQEVVQALIASVESTPGVALLGSTMDTDHHRSVLTFAGEPEPVLAAAMACAAYAVEHIDLNRHSGVHPRLGAIDVIPLVPVRQTSLAECAELARSLGARLWRELRLPVYFYEAAAQRPGRVRLEAIRRGGFELLREVALTDPGRAPDVGGPALHRTAGATAVGARKFLIAFNVNLESVSLDLAKQIARTIRASSGGLPAVKALGLPLASRGQVQVSINLVDFEQTPLHIVVDAVRREAAREGVRIAGTELIGLLPERALELSAGHNLQWENFDTALILENSLRQKLG